MSTFVLSDCLRATPSRTLAALIVAMARRARAAVFPGQPAFSPAGLCDRTLADIGLSRTAMIHEV